MTDVLLKPAFVSLATDSGDTTKLGPNAWNAARVFSAGSLGDIAFRDTGSATGASWLPDVAVGSVLVSGGVGAAPAWSSAPTLTSLTTSGLVNSGAGGFETIGTTGSVGLYAQRTTRFGVEGVSTSQIGVYGHSTSSNGVRGDSLSGVPGFFTQTGALAASNGSSTLHAQRASTLGAFDLTGAVLRVEDTTAATGNLIQARKSAADQFTVGPTGNVVSLGTVRATGTSGLLTVIGGAFNNAAYGQLGVGSDPHSNVLFHVLDVDFTPGAGATTGYGAVIYPKLHALDPFTRLTGLMVGPTWTTPATSSISEVSSIYMPINAITSGGGGSIGTGATLLIDGAPTFSGTKTDGLYALKIKAGLSAFGGAVRMSGLGAFAAGDKYLTIDASGNLHISALGPAS